MRNNELISKQLNDALEYLSSQETKLKPFIDKLQDILLKRISEDEITTYQAFEMFTKIQEQYTNSILLVTKIKEIMDFKG